MSVLGTFVSTPTIKLMAAKEVPTFTISNWACDFLSAIPKAKKSHPKAGPLLADALLHLILL